MDSLNRAAAQLRGLIESMSPGARFLAGLLLAVAAISVGMVYQPSNGSPEEVLFGGDYLPDSQLNRIEAAIAQAGLSGHRRDGKQILVPADQKSAYLAAVADADALPPNFNTMLERALDNSNPLASREETRERLKIARQQTLSEIVRAMHWVEDAVVLYDEQESTGLSGKKQVTCSVNVKPKTGEQLDSRRTQMLRTLVAHAVVGLRPEDIAVTNLGDCSMDETEGCDFEAAFDDEHCRTRVAYEQYKRQSILNALSDIPGVRVEVNVELDDTRAETNSGEKSSTAGDKQPAPRTTPPGLPDDSRPTTFAQGPGRKIAGVATDGDIESEADKNATALEVAAEDNQRAPGRGGFEPKQVWATVTIPHSYIETIWTQRHSDASRTPLESELQILQASVVAKVESIVEPLLPRPADSADREKQVRVVVLDSISASPIAVPSLASQAWKWAGKYRDTWVVLGVAVTGLAVLWLAVPAGAKRNSTAEGSGFRARSDDTEPDRPTMTAQPQRLMQFDDLSKLDDATLAALIQEVEPEVMALALAGSNDALMNRIMSQVPREVAKKFREQLTRLGPTRLRDVEAAQRAVAAAAARRLDPTQPQPVRQAA